MNTSPLSRNLSNTLVMEKFIIHLILSMIEDSSPAIKNCSENVYSLKETSVSCLKCVHGSELRCNIQWMKSRKDNISQVRFAHWLPSLPLDTTRNEWKLGRRIKEKESVWYQRGGESKMYDLLKLTFLRSRSLEEDTSWRKKDVEVAGGWNLLRPPLNSR